MEKRFLHPDQKALNINLDPTIYGAFAEIGAGQEVARNFFKVGAAAGTIAKTMSAYDKAYSDAIYGADESGRYVCESRLYKMLDHEFQLLEERLTLNSDKTKFFVFADTVSAINYQKTNKGNGWMGVRFQLDPCGKPNDLIIHVKMKDNDNLLQQEAIGLLGVNMIYACYFYNHDLEGFVASLLDGVSGRVEVDMMRLSGPDYQHVEQSLLSLDLVKHGLTEVAMFDADGVSIHASEFLYKKPLVVVRGHYQPPTLVTEDVLVSSLKQFGDEPNVDEKKARVVAEITLDNLMEDGEISDKDFLDRAASLGAMDYITILSNCSNHQRLITYLEDYKVTNLGMVIGVKELQHLIYEKYEENKDGRLLAAFGELFTRNITIYVYPAIHEETGEVMTIHNMEVPAGMEFLLKYLLESKQLVPINNYNAELLRIFPRDIRDQIINDTDGWQSKVPASVAQLIEEKKLFGHRKHLTNV
jgi:hypothetical protein